MKALTYILSFYILILAVIPCCAFDNCPDEKTESTSHEPGDKDCGNCSPFFNCEGCATATTITEPVLPGIAPIKVLSVYTVYKQQQLPDIQYEFWQPPKIG